MNNAPNASSTPKEDIENPVFSANQVDALLHSFAQYYRIQLPQLSKSISADALEQLETNGKSCFMVLGKFLYELNCSALMSCDTTKLDKTQRELLEKAYKKLLCCDEKSMCCPTQMPYMLPFMQQSMQQQQNPYGSIFPTAAGSAFVPKKKGGK
jgi:hypothetical protein